MVYQLEIIWMCGLNSYKLPKASNFAKEKFQLSSLVCTCTTTKNSLIYPILREYGYQLSWIPVDQATCMERSDPNQFDVIALWRVLHWVWDPTHRCAIKVGSEAERFSGDPLPHSNHQSVWCIILETMLTKTLFCYGVSIFCPGREAKKMMASSHNSWRQNTRLNDTWYFTIICPTPISFLKREM